MRSRVSPQAVFVAFAMIAGILQVLASVRLGVARVDAIARAANEGAGYYVLGGVAVALGIGVTWIVRRRPIVAGLVFIVWQMMVFWPLSRRTTSLGLAYHGEYILHHFTVMLSGAACLAVAWSWWKREEVPKIRLAPAMLAAVGAGALLVLHMLSQPAIGVKAGPGYLQVLHGILLLAPIVAMAVFWKRLQPRMLAYAVILVMLPMVFRIAVSFPGGLIGESIPIWARPFLMVTIFIGATAAFAAFRPEMPRALRILSIALSAIATGLLYVIYTRLFGELEDGIDGLVQSLFAYPLPYPNYVSPWKIYAVTIAIFFIFSTVYAGLLSYNERVRGTALALLAITGVGLSNPQLVLMAGAGLLLVIDTLTHEPESDRPVDPPSPIEDILAAAAEEIGLPAPVVLETAAGSVMALRGDVEGAAVDLRARPIRAGGWELTLRAGVMGRGRPDVELVPDEGDAGDRPPHEIGRTHRVRGSVRALEHVGDASLDSLVPFSDATARFWAAGAEIDFGRDLSSLDHKGLATLVRALAAR